MADGLVPPTPAPEEGAAAPQVGSPEEAMSMIAVGMDALISNAPSPEMGQALSQIRDQIVQVIGQAGQPSAGGPVSPEAGVAPGARPMG